MTFTFNEEYRQSQEYKEWVSAIKRDYPSLPLYLIESAIIQHKTDPQYYKKAKDAKEVFKKGFMPRKNPQETIVEGAIKVEPPLQDEPSTTITEEV
jgi:hypothetical protein